MILGRFPWRDMEIEADMIANDLIGEAIWLNRIDNGSATPMGIVRRGRLFPTKFTPPGDTAVIELRAAYDAFRESKAAA